MGKMNKTLLKYTEIKIQIALKKMRDHLKIVDRKIVLNLSK